MQQQHTISRLDCDMRRKADCIKPAMASWVVGLRSSKALPKVKLAPKKRSWFTAGWSAAHLIRLSESLRNHYIWEACSTNQWDALKTATPSASTGQEKVPNSPWKHPTRHHTTNTSNVEWIGPWSFASPAIFTRPLANWWPFLQISWQLLQEKCFHNQPDAENAFHEFVKSRSMNFYTTGINKLMKG